MRWEERLFESLDKLNDTVSGMAAKQASHTFQFKVIWWILAAVAGVVGFIIREIVQNVLQ